MINFLNNHGLDYEPTKEQFLFGFLDQKSHSPSNFTSLVLKKYIWKTKFRSAILSMVGFKAALKSYLCDLKYYFVFKNQSELFNEWNTVFDEL